MLIVLSRAVVLSFIILLMSNSYSQTYSHRISDKEINLISQQMCSHIDPTIKLMDEELIVLILLDGTQQESHVIV